MKKISLLCLLIISILFFSCIESKQDYTLNPDKSGKVKIEALFQQMNISMGGEKENQDPDIQMKKAVKKIIEKSKGVSVWKNVTYKLKDDGRILFKGTAYFKDISKLKIHNISMMNVDFKKAKNKTMVLILKDEKGEKGDRKKKKPGKMTDKEIKKQIKKQKAGYQQMKPMLKAFLSSMKMDAAFKLPGKVKSFVNFKKTKTKALRIVFEGEKLLKILDKFAQDDKWWKSQVASGKDVSRDSSFFDPAINEHLFGKKGPIEAVVSGKLRPLFNYKAEVRKAKKKYPAILKKLSVKKKSVEKPLAKGGKFKKLSVGGVRLIRVSDWDTGIRAFHSEKGYTLSLIGKLPGAVLRIVGGKITKAKASNGKTLMHPDEWKHEIKFFTLSKDKTTVNFEVDMKVPGKKVKRLKFVSGYLDYISAAKLKKVDLGIKSFETDSKGDKYGSLIKSLKESKWQKDTYDIEIKIGLPVDGVKSITYYNKDKLKLDTFELSRNEFGKNKSVFIHSYKGEFPESGSIVVEVYENIKKYRIPFLLKNIDLMGNKR